MRFILPLAIFLMTWNTPVLSRDLDAIPTDFPRFLTSGTPEAAQSQEALEWMRKMYWLHYPQVHHQPTLWDEWLVGPTLWPAVDVEKGENPIRAQWRQRFDNRKIDETGYVSTHQHASIAQQTGWPFPAWIHGRGGIGWHFSFRGAPGAPWRHDTLSTQKGWVLRGARDEGIDDDGWQIALERPMANVTTPAQSFDSIQAPFVQIRWKSDARSDSGPYIEWRREGEADFDTERRMYFNPPLADSITFLDIPLYRHPRWNGTIAQMRLGAGNAEPTGRVTLQALFTAYDTRHNINSQSLITGYIQYFHWTRDIDFLRRHIVRMRLALRHMMEEHQTLEKKIVHTTWVGHDGRPGYTVNDDGSKTFHYGQGIGNNYWDLVPFGAKDAYATLRYYDSLLKMAALEREIEANPEWNIFAIGERFDPDFLLRHAAEVKETGNRVFLNPETKRFVACICEDGIARDYGFTFVNIEALFYDFATPENARDILAWLDGERIVEGDTSTGADIYHWRFAPRATTKRNVEYYYWGWTGPESLPFGGQIQDGGAVLGFSYHDVMARLRLRGPEDAWNRLNAIAEWFAEVQAAGGYRQYYDGTREGTLQGGGTAGGLGLDHEFTESMLVPQVLIDGFLGFAPTGNGFRIEPQLPKALPRLRIDGIHIHELILDIEAAEDTIRVLRRGEPNRPWRVILPEGEWTVRRIAANETTLNDGTTDDSDLFTESDGAAAMAERDADGAVRVEWGDAGTAGLLFQRRNGSPFFE